MLTTDPVALILFLNNTFILCEHSGRAQDLIGSCGEGGNVYRELGIRPPFFEIGPKCYLFGDQLMALAQAADRAAGEYSVHVIFDPPQTALAEVARATRNIFVFAQHMDALEPGRGMGYVPAEAVKATGAAGTILNHAEHPLSIASLASAIGRADSLKIGTMVCADTISEAAAIAHLKPNIIVAEPTELIGSGQRSTDEYVAMSTRAVKAVDPEILVLQGAGIRSAEDVYDVIRAGADATGTSSGVAKAKDPETMAIEMIQAVREAWNERQGEV